MIDKANEKHLYDALDLIEKSCVKCWNLKDFYVENEYEKAADTLKSITELTDKVKAEYNFFKKDLEYAYASEMIENTGVTIAEIEGAVSDGNYERAAFKSEFQLLPFLRLLWESFYFRGVIYPDQERQAQYYREEYAEHFRNIYINRSGYPKHKLSIVIVGYNHLETTKKCVEQLIARTDFDKLNAELILIDHGSTDGTLEYFESLKKYKVIHCKNNIHMSVFGLMFQVCLGEYFCFVSNDVLVTKNWAEILLTCMESDKKIICATPATPNISNLQTYDVPDTTPTDSKEFIKWANNQNKSNPSLWQDRTRIMPAMAVYNTQNVNAIGFGDPYYYTMEFWDDDFSLRARRAGYRQILCKDVACYHFGSVTTNEAKTKESTLEFGRQLFIKKNGVDPWVDGYCYDPNVIRFFTNNLILPGNPAFLGIDCEFGDTSLQFRNEMRKAQKDSRLYMLTKQSEFMPDLSKIGDEAEYAPDLVKGVRECFAGEKFAAVYIGQNISEYPEYPGLLEELSYRMDEGALLIFACENPFFAVNINAFLKFSLPQDKAVVSFVNTQRLKQELGKHFSQIMFVPLQEEVEGADIFVQRYFPEQTNNEQFLANLKTRKYYIVCRK